MILFYDLKQGSGQFDLHRVLAIEGKWEDNCIDSYVYISDDVEKLKTCWECGGAIIALLTKENIRKDISFCHYAVLDTVAINDEYLNMVFCRNKGIPLLINEGNNVIIREITPDDSEDIYCLYSDKNVRKYMGVFYDNSDEITRIIRNYYKEVYEFYNYGIWGIYLKSSGIFIGLIGFTPRENGLELGYAIDDKYRMHGYAQEAIGLVLDYAREYLEEKNIVAYVDSENIESLRILKKFNFIEIERSNIITLQKILF